jgi:DNA-binding transcriptional LysR family regulator
MRVTHLRQSDLNLLVVFAALAEERTITGAASRLFLSQPAVSRALQRLRGMFKDDLFIRTPAGYQLTPKGQAILRELEVALPRLDRLIGGDQFDPSIEEATFRIAGRDHAFSVLCPVFCRQFLPAANKVSFEFVAAHDGSFTSMERGRIDLVLCSDDEAIPPNFESEVLYEEGVVCVVAKENSLPQRLTLKRYLDSWHISVKIKGSEPTIVEKSLASLGVKRRSAIRMPYLWAALRSVPGTEYMVTVPKRLGNALEGDRTLRVLKPPPELHPFKYLMVWHRRMNSDAAHNWLRKIIRKAGRAVSANSRANSR